MIKSIYWYSKFCFWRLNKKCLKCKQKMQLNRKRNIITDIPGVFIYDNNYSITYMCYSCNLIYDNKIFIYKNIDEQYSFKKINKLLNLKGFW